MKNLLARAIALVKSTIAKYPARVISYVAAAIVFVAAHLGVVLPTESVVAALGFVVPILLSGEATHHVVTPAKPAVPAAK